MKAARQGSEVILLDMRDASANQAMQEYNDALSDNCADTAYRAYVDHLAEIFNGCSLAGKTGQPQMPGEQQLLIADRLVSWVVDGHK